MIIVSQLAVCQLCRERGATLFCTADKANLCTTCDEKVHSVNDIASNHKRTTVEDIKWYIKGAEEWLRQVFEDLKDKLPRNGRGKHLVALPLIGTGKGGASYSSGGMVLALLPALYKAANEYNYDIAIVSIKRSAFAAIQLERKRFCKKHNLWDGLLEESLRIEAGRLATLARKGKLVLFLGSGVSAGAGMPTWKELLVRLAQHAEMNEQEIKILNSVNMTYYELHPPFSQYDLFFKDECFG